MGSDAQILVMIDDLPSTDAAPPENVLFVCRLNAVTRDEDLRVIFAQFGKVTECAVVRDWKTGDSLSYAFVAFERVCDCQRAYTQMENVLIDDRRIHVDFSQSVAHYYWHHQRKGKFTKEKHSQHLRVRHANKQGRSEKRGKEAGPLRFESVGDGKELSDKFNKSKPAKILEKKRDRKHRRRSRSRSRSRSRERERERRSDRKRR